MRGALQPLAVLSENFSVASGPLRSTQLRMTPLDETCSCGCALSGADGLVIGSIFSGQAAGFCGTVASKGPVIDAANRVISSGVVRMRG